MKTLMIMTRDFKLLGEIPQFNSLIYTRSHYGVGDFSLEISPGASCAEQLAQGVLLYDPEAPHKMMLVEDYYIDEKAIKLNGCQLKGDVRKRICVPPLSLPTTLYQWDGLKWLEITDQETIYVLMQGDVYEGYAFPLEPRGGMVFSDMSALATVYDWDTKSQTGETWLDLGVAQLRSKYKNFGWDSFIGSAESAIKHFVSNNLTAPEDGKRLMPGWAMAPDQSRGLALPWRARFDKLDTFLAAIGEATGMGYDLTPDFASKQFVLEVVEGNDYSKGKKRVVIATDMGNAEGVSLQMQLMNTYTTAYTGGAGEDAQRLILTVSGENTGTDRREMWVDAGSVDNPEDLNLNGRNKLADAAPRVALSAKVIDTGACKYERDWDVGDIVLIRRQGAITATRILSVTETYERDRARQLDVVFGSGTVSLASVLKRMGTITVR